MPVSNASMPATSAIAVGAGRPPHHVRLDRRVRQELAAERVGPHWDGSRRAVRPLFGSVGRVQHAVRAVQGHPAAAALDPRSNGLLLVGRRAQIARVGHEKVRRRDGGDITEVLRHPDPHVIVDGEQLQELEPGEVEVVVLAATDQVGVDASLTLRTRPASLRSPLQRRCRRSPYPSTLREVRVKLVISVGVGFRGAAVAWLPACRIGAQRADRRRLSP